MNNDDSGLDKTTEAYTYERAVKDKERTDEERELARIYDEQVKTWFDERELRLIANCQTYANNDPAGLPGHNLMIIINKLCDFLGFQFPDSFKFADIDEDF